MTTDPGQDRGASFGPGSQASPDAPADHRPSGFDPSRVDWLDIPYCRQTGRYVFFSACGAGVGAMAGAFSRLAHISSYMEHAIAVVACVATFLALRDMSEQWNWVLHAHASGTEARRAKTGTGFVHDGPAPKADAKDTGAS